MELSLTIDLTITPLTVDNTNAFWV